MRTNYDKFIAQKAQSDSGCGFEPVWMPDFLFDFQQALVAWAVRKGRAAIFADCGLGKSPMQLVVAENIVRKTGKRVLILTPLAVAQQTCREAEKFGIEARRSVAGELHPGINVTNYERLHFFKPEDFVAVALDESSILKSFDGTRRSQITEFMRTVQYRSLWTATAAPNDYTELGTSSEALGYLGHMDMLSRFFKNDQNSSHPMRKRSIFDGGKWRFKGHAELPFWRWVCSWAIACRKPSDLGFDNGRFVLPKLTETDHLVEVKRLASGMLFSLPAIGLDEQRAERRRSITERSERAAALVNGHHPALMWCHLNEEGDLLERLVPGAIQVSGDDDDDAKEEKLTEFAQGNARVLITKPKIGAWGLNLQHCSHVTTFPSHSYEQYYQGVRRCWRFGQTQPVQVDIITTEGERSVLKSLQRKSAQADKMFSDLVAQMNDSMALDRSSKFNLKEKLPTWL